MSTGSNPTNKESGRGDEMRHGRSALSPLDGSASDRPELRQAMHRLLALEHVQVTSHSAQVEGRRIHHIEAGTGRPLLLIHGASGGGANWYRLLGEVSAHRRVLAVDLPGFGFSDAIEPVANLGLRTAEVLIAWLDQLGIGALDVAGTSFGGLVALRMAQRLPERIARVALIDAAGLGGELPLTVRAACHPMLASAALRPSRPGTRWQLRSLMIDDPTRLPPGHEDALVEYLWQSARAADAARVTRAFTLFASLRGQREVLTDEELRAFPAELLILWGECDRFLPRAHAERAHALVPNARIRIIPRAGHSPNWEAPAAVLAALRTFLEPDPALDFPANL